ncbi:hypothetical protein [Herbiconiux daphne]|uniref:DUF2550 family protein n=1 Tax=Herbiconiux daphne TaxID=2970914 RepID=A0ABT2H1J9_9MICO|nr:hypothetical protein [Herbiconiux daphne]MCS5733790.1 hypothetical protein [Herbiconiux daphne]
MNFWDTVLASILGTSGAGVLAWVGVLIRRRYLRRGVVWRVRPLGPNSWGLKYVGRRTITEVTLSSAGADGMPRAGSQPPPQGSTIYKGGKEFVMPGTEAGGVAYVSWNDSRGHWIARILLRPGLDSWWVKPELRQKKGATDVTDLT